MKSFNKSKTPKRSAKNSPSIYSTVNSALSTTISSPKSSNNIFYLQQKIKKLKSKLYNAKLTLINQEQDRIKEKEAQKKFMKIYHAKMFEVIQNFGNHLKQDDESLILQEKNNIDAAWSKRYNDLKIFYEEKINQIEKKQNLCNKCKVFIKSEEILKKNSDFLKYLEKENNC